MPPLRKVIVIGLDGLEPSLVEPMLSAGSLPCLGRLQQTGGRCRVATTHPAQTPVAWSTFATGMNPGAHGIFDFLAPDRKSYLPQLALNRYERTNPLAPARVVNLQRGKTVWDHLSESAIASVLIRCPCTYPPPETVQGRVLAGMGVPDLRGSLGVSTFYTSAPGVQSGESESVVLLEPGDSGCIRTHVLGPLHPKTRTPVHSEIVLEVSAAAGRVLIRSPHQPQLLEAVQGRWREWLPVKFKMGPLQRVRGMVRFFVVQLEPFIEIHASPVNFDPQAPLFPISSPKEYAGELAKQLGAFYTTGMVEEHGGLNNGRLDEAAFLDQCEQVMRERESMLRFELDRTEEGLIFCLFDTPDRVQHMFWRFQEPDHPANRGSRNGEFRHVIEEQHRDCDAVVGKVLEYVDDRTLLVVLSDHGFGSFQRGVRLNTWLWEHGLLSLRDGLRPGAEAGDLLRSVEWRRTKAYALGLGGIHLNVNGRESQGIVDADEAPQLKQDIAAELSKLTDPQRGQQAVRRVLDRDAVYRGPYADEAPDLLVDFMRGYRASWDTAMGGIPHGCIEDNTRRWAGDHCVDPELVPGILFLNRPFDGESAGLVDLAPTILEAFGLEKPAEMEGEPLLR